MLRPLDPAISALVERVVRTRFDPDAVDEVRTVAGEDSQGDPLLRVTIVGDDPSALGRGMGRARSEVHEALDAHGDLRFPLMGVLSRADVKRAQSKRIDADAA